MACTRPDAVVDEVLNGAIDAPAFNVDSTIRGTRFCLVKRCGAVVPRSHVLCARHWAGTVSDVQGDFMFWMTGGDPTMEQRARMAAVLDFYVLFDDRIAVLESFTESAGASSTALARDLLVSCGTIDSDHEGGIRQFLRYASDTDLDDDFTGLSPEQEQDWIAREVARLQIAASHRLTEERREQAIRRRAQVAISQRPPRAPRPRRAVRGTFSDNMPPPRRKVHSVQSQPASADLAPRIRGLCADIPKPARSPKGGRPPVPLADAVFACLVQTSVGDSTRGIVDELQRLRSAGLIRYLPSPNTIGKYMGAASMTPILTDLLSKTAPTDADEVREELTEFMVCRYAVRFNESAQAAQRKRQWLLARVVYDARTGAVRQIERVAVRPEVTDDVPREPSLAIASLKARFGAAVRARTDTAMDNELICKAICHNLALRAASEPLPTALSAPTPQTERPLQSVFHRRNVQPLRRAPAVLPLRPPPPVSRAMNMN